MNSIKKIIFITIDSLRRDHLGLFGYQRNTFPVLEKLLENSILFREFYSNGTNTPSTLKSIFTSTYPLAYEDYGYYPEKLSTIPKILKEKGFITIGIHNNPTLSRYYNWGKDFDLFFDFHKLYNFFRHKEKYPIYLNAEEINKVTLNQIRKYKTEKVFLWLHYMDVHFPYTQNKKSLKFLGKETKINNFWDICSNSRTITEEELQIAIDLYDSKIFYVNYELEKLLIEMEKLNWLEDSLLIITSDHGEEFLEHGEVFHQPKLYDELLKVFLLIYSNSLKKKIIYDGLCNQIDILPTILDFLGIDYRSYPTIMGKSLKDIISNKKIKLYDGIISEVSSFTSSNWDVRKTSYRTKEWKYILDYQNKKEYLFDLINDPGEKNNLIKKEKKLKYFRDIIKRHIEKEKRLKIKTNP